MKRSILTWLMLLSCITICAQGVKPLPTLHVDGKWLVDEHGNHVVLHGVMDTPNMYFNGWRWGSPWDGSGTGYNSTGVTKCKDYFEKIFTAMEKAKCTVFRLHLDPAWTNDPSESYVYPGAADQPAEATSEADIKKFNPTRLKTYLSSLYWPLIKKAIDHRMYVVVRPPGVCPPNLKVGDYYQQYLMTVWDMVSSNTNIQKYAGQISIELANEPVNLKNANNADDPKALHDYFQPIVDKIRANGFTGIIWVPGTGWQSNYTSYATYPIEGYNIGYAVHDYCGWYGSSDDNPGTQNKINNFLKQVPVVETSPIIITEFDWSPENPDAEGHYDEHGNWVLPNYGTWATGSTSKWGKAYKANIDYYKNISMTLSSTDCLFDIDTYISSRQVVPAFGGLEEACGKACMDWYAEYYDVDWAHADFANTSVSDLGTGKFQNPVIFADFPDPDVIRVDDTYYMITTTIHHFPGATILKSKDLVNWQYCAQPLEQLATTDNYNLLNGQNAYGKGMWACSMKYHDGTFYVLINGNDAGGFLLTATNPEGRWEKKKLSRIYYDPGMLFDNGKVYVACGIGNIQICELDEDFNYIHEQNVISDKSGLEGCHLYKIGDYYYIYATYGGWPSGQVVFRSQNIFGPYEEKMLIEKYIDGTPNTVHQGALIDTPEGEWWTILQEDLGALGRMPNLQPVKWVDEWPVIGNNGVPYTTCAKPKTATSYPVKALPTNDNFRSYPIGMQWEWNHNPDNGAWSLFERAGWLRMKTSEPADRLTQARNMLTQRIFAFHKKPNQASMGTVSIDISNLKEGDRAGICILQDPYAAIAVEMKDGKKQFVWWQDQLTENEGFTPASVTGEVIDADTVYLRAEITYGTSLTQFYYSLDNKTFTLLGEQTTLKYNLSVFVGARFGIFCYATQENAEHGYADFDWFSTEKDYDEAKYYPADFPGYDEDMLTVESIEVAKSEAEVMIGNVGNIILTATYRDGHTANVAAEAGYEIDNDVVSIRGGQIQGLKEGTANIRAIYTDPLGNTLTTQFTAVSTLFPFAAQYIKTDLYGQGTYTERTHTFKPSQYGQMGWVYSNGADMSGYKYLVVQLKSRSNNSHLNIFTGGSVWSPGYSTPDFGTSKQIVVDLENIKYTTDGDLKGQPLDTKNIQIVCFWGTGSQSILVKDVYLTNNDDYSREETTDVIVVDDETPQVVDVWTMSGQSVRKAVSIEEATQGLAPGFYIVGKQKVLVR